MAGVQKSLKGKNILITGGAVRVGREIGLSLAEAGANLVIHYNSSAQASIQTKQDIEAKGVDAHLIQADLSDPAAGAVIIDQAEAFGPLYGLINNASIFDAIDLSETSLEEWNLHLDINLTAPLILTQAFAEKLGKTRQGRIINILDWRALRPGTDHFPYTISKAGLAALTQSSAQALAPNITVNGIAFGAILPPSDGGDVTKLLEQVPANRWAEMKEVGDTVCFLLEGPAYITGEIIHLDGGRHLV
jgi:NAD(P)-dependent dehydrogenase (short-subunit alcohol dehydrogenase family)